MRRTPQGNIELMPQKQVLDFNPAPRPERAGDKRHKQAKEWEHYVESCADSASLRESARIRFSGATTCRVRSRRCHCRSLPSNHCIRNLRGNRHCGGVMV